MKRMFRALSVAAVMALIVPVAAQADTSNYRHGKGTMYGHHSMRSKMMHHRMHRMYHHRMMRHHRHMMMRHNAM